MFVCNVSLKTNELPLVVPVFNVAITLQEKRQSFLYDPLNSLLFVQALQESERQIPQVSPLKPQQLIFKTKYIQLLIST